MQSEWIFDIDTGNENLSQAVLLVRCWIHGDKKEYNYYNYYDKNQCSKYINLSKNIMGTEKYNQILSKLKHRQQVKENAQTQSKLRHNSTIVPILIDFFAPCVRATSKLLLENRRNLLMGGWINWNRYYNYDANYQQCTGCKYER